MTILTRSFFAQPTLSVARGLLGQRLVREIDGRRLAGLIVETEAYIGPRDTANHASRGRTPRTQVMFGPPGYIYVYVIYGMYHMLNFITEQEGFPAAVLIRAIEPVEGIEVMQSLRQRASGCYLTNGPGKLTQALGVDKNLNRRDATQGRQLWLEAGEPLPDTLVAIGPRVGIDSAAAKDRLAPWRFWIEGNRFVSKA